MLREKFSGIKEIFNKKTEGNNKRNIENLVVFLVLLIITVIAINIIWGGDDDAEELEERPGGIQLVQNLEDGIFENTNIDSGDNTYGLEENLRNILSRIVGVRRSRCSNYIFRNK